MAHWYITAQAVREWQAIHGLPPADDGWAFSQAERSLLRLMDACDPEQHLRTDEGRRSIWRIKWEVRGRMTRIELTVSHATRSEGTLDQLVRVRDKGR